MRQGERGFTMIELLMAMVIMSISVGGILMARITSARMMRSQRNVSFAEASGYAQQSAERNRNDIACDNGAWFDAACDINAVGLPGWTPDPMPAGGSESLMTLDPAARRCRRVVPAPGGTCGAADCVQVDVVVCWNGTVCPC